MTKKISLPRLEGFLKARCDDLRSAGLDATEYRDYIIAMIFLKRVNDNFAKQQKAYLSRLRKEYPDVTEAELMQEVEVANASEYEFYVPLKARWKIEDLPVAVHSDLSQKLSEAKAKLEDGRITGVNRERWQKEFSDAEYMLNWKGLLNVKSDVGDALTIALAALEEEPTNSLSLGGVLSSTKFNAVNSNGVKKLSDAVLMQLINDFNSITLTDDNFEFPDLLGAAYEYLIKYFAESAGKKGGEFYTPTPVVELMARILQPERNAEICDPTVGSGGLLITMRNYVESRYGTARDLTLCGQELIDHTYKMCKMNMIFHGIKDARIEHGDTLLNPKLTESGRLRLFDIVVANPPFSQNYTTKDMKYMERFAYFMPKKKRADFMFVQHMVSTLKSDGRMAVVMPHGVLFRSGDEQKYRKELIAGENGCVLECVIGLPEGLFYGTTIPASILIINKKDAKNRAGVLFINADREYAEGKNQNSLRPEDVEKISYVYSHKSELPKYSRLVRVAELAAEEYNCNIRRYVDNAPDAEPQDVEAHLSGGIPKEEIDSCAPLFAPWGDVAGTLFVNCRKGYLRFRNTVDSAEKIGTVVRESKGVAETLSAYEKLVEGFWTGIVPDLIALPENKNVFSLCEKLLGKFSAHLSGRQCPVLDEFQTRGSFAHYIATLRADFKSVATSAWNAELIPDDEILESQFPQVLSEYRSCQERKEELQSKFDAVAALEEDEWNAEDYEVMPKSEIARIRAEIKSAKGELRELNKATKALEKRAKAYSKKKEPVPAEITEESARTEAKKAPLNQTIDELEKTIARHSELEAELATCSQRVREIERHKDELVESAREKISPEEARKLILARWKRTLRETLAAYLEAHLRVVVSSAEALYSKYTVTLNQLLEERGAAAEKLDGFLAELGYASNLR